MTPRYLFLCPAQRAPSGGIAVIYECVNQLVAAGYSAAVLHEITGVSYENTPHRPPIMTTSIFRRKDFSFRISLRHPLQILNKVIAGLRLLKRRVFVPNNDLASLSADDVIVVPDYLLDYVARTVPTQPKVLLSQNSFLHLDSYGRAISAGYDPNAGLVWAVGINQTTLDAIKVLAACPASKVVVCPNLLMFDFSVTKRRQIAYMPRKRPEEAVFIEHLLRQRGKLDGFELVAVDGMPQAEVARILRESLVFISLMRNEALGFPAIEAMAAGCVVVGYTGLGTQEYFDSTTGIPIVEGDTVGVVAAVEGIVAEYQADSGRLDAMRQFASESVRHRFRSDQFVSGLLESWAQIDATLKSTATNRETTLQAT